MKHFYLSLLEYFDQRAHEARVWLELCLVRWEKNKQVGAGRRPCRLAESRGTRCDVNKHQ